MKRTENPAEHGLHIWQRAGLGIAPFRFIGFSQKTYVACHGAPVQPGACCAYCGQGIINCCEVKDSTGRRFVVGIDCIERVGEAGILKMVKTSAEYRAHQAELRNKKAEAVTQAISALLIEQADTLRSIPHPNGFRDRATRELLTAHDYLAWMFQNSGASGRKRALKIVQSSLASL